MPREVQLRYYVDADLLGIAKLLIQLRADVTYPGDPGGIGIDKRYRPPCPVASTNVKDVDWIPLVASQGWTILTRDARISRLPEERRAVRETGARMVVVGSGEAHAKLRKWDQLEVIFTQWRRIEALTELPGPWIYRATRSSLTKLDVVTGKPRRQMPEQRHESRMP